MPGISRPKLLVTVLTPPSGPTYETPAYANEGGTGNRSRWITVTPSAGLVGTMTAYKQLLVNGNQADGAAYPSAVAAAGEYIDFIFPHKVLIPEFKIYQSLTPAATHGTWKCQIDPENDGNLQDAGGNFTLGGGAIATYTSMAANTTRFKRLRLLGVSGNTNTGGFAYFDEVEFKISSPVDQYRSVLVLGDSKSILTTSTTYPQYLFGLLNTATGKSWKEVLPRGATGGWTIAEVYVWCVNNIASVTPVPQYALLNIGVNDGAMTEANWRIYLDALLELIHTTFPSCQVYVTRPWLQGNEAYCDNVATRISDIVTLYLSYAHLGADERVYLKGSDDGATWTSDGIHPTDPAGYQLMSQKAGEAMGLL
jgi:hypothetical protein